MKNLLSIPIGIVAAASLSLFLVLLPGFAFSQPPTPQAQQGKVVGLAFQSISVSNLERSVAYYKALGFDPIGDEKSPWIKDEPANRLYRTPGAMCRTARLSLPSNGSGQPFLLLLREYKDFKRNSRADYPARNPSSAHFGMVVPDADALWAHVKTSGMLRALSWDSKLVRMPGQSSGGIAYVMDPDGFNIEIIGVKMPPAAAGQKTPQDRPSFHHVGLAVLNSAKSMDFYGGVLSAKFPKVLPDWVGGDMYDAAVGGHGFVIRLINGSYPETAAPQSDMRFELVEYRKPIRPDVDAYSISDIAVSSVGLEVVGLDALYSRLKSAGANVWPAEGALRKGDGTRAIVVRDPDVGAFVELFEKLPPAGRLFQALLLPG
jgi:catechol 2,3-dioxygenase-like lactoylglutathione lyase family enzyme